MGSEQSMIDPEVLNDLRRDTSYNVEEIVEWYKKFSKTYPSGYLTVEEYKVELGEKFPNGDSSIFAEHMFRFLDANRDGRLDFREYFTYIYLTSSRARTDQKIEFVFNLYDIDGNGRIFWDEIREVVESVYKATGKLEKPADEAIVNNHISDFFKYLDRNQDGEISLEEFTDSIQKVPGMVNRLRSDPLTFCVVY